MSDLLRQFLKNIKCNIYSRDGNNCWIWQKYKDKKYGYGQWQAPGPDGKGLVQYAHRIMYRLWHNLSFEHMQDKFVMHKCDNPSCVNPLHLGLGSNFDNVQDCIRKRRHPYGEKSVYAKLKNDDIPIIWQFIKSGMRDPEIAIKYGVTREAIRNLRLGKAWKLVTADCSK